MSPIPLSSEDAGEDRVLFDDGVASGKQSAHIEDERAIIPPYPTLSSEDTGEDSAREHFQLVHRQEDEIDKTRP